MLTLKYKIYSVVFSPRVIGRNIISQILYKYFSMNFVSDLNLNLEKYI